MDWREGIVACVRVPVATHIPQHKRKALVSQSFASPKQAFDNPESSRAIRLQRMVPRDIPVEWTMPKSANRTDIRMLSNLKHLF
jgi:hypothetical protein